MMFNGANLGNMYEAKINWGVALEPTSERNCGSYRRCPRYFATTTTLDEAWKFATY
jgi:hypothetical protein